ncbi:MAG TPA: SDR family NAD(P)-dependent oxidoreductase [Myxococcaceae bacterium]|nr:SDR family NAD(P)-dependent oxidoreductase [Myxococcaceae bacterium]
MVAKLGRVVVGAASVLALRGLLRRRFELSGRVVLLTGGSRGLGLVLARELARRGAKLAICGRDVEPLERARAELEGLGAEVYAEPFDVGDRTQVEELVRRTRARFGRIDVLINNAGTIEVGPVEVMDRQDYEEAMAIHYWAPLNAILAVLPEMEERGEGRIVNITSIGGKVPIPHLLPYSASKFALVGLSEGLRAELADKGIRVTTVCPGLMRTGSPLHAFFKGKHRAEYTWFKLMDSLPGFSISAERAALSIIRALERGESEVILSLPAKLATWTHGLWPGLTSDLLGLVSRLLPKPGGIGHERAEGRESESAVSRSFITGLTDRAAVQNNQM